MTTTLAVSPSLSDTGHTDILDPWILPINEPRAEDDADDIDFDEEDFDDDFDDDFSEEDDFEDDLPDELSEDDLKSI